MFMDRVTCRESCKRHMAVSRKAWHGKRGYSAMAKGAHMMYVLVHHIIEPLCTIAVP